MIEAVIDVDSDSVSSNSDHDADGSQDEGEVSMDKLFVDAEGPVGCKRPGRVPSASRGLLSAGRLRHQRRVFIELEAKESR